MRVLDTVLLAALSGITEVLPVSRSGHEAVARLWLGGSSAGLALAGTLQLGTALAIGVVARDRLFDLIGEGVRAVARPSLFRTSDGAKDAAALFVGASASLAVSSLLRSYVEILSDAPIAVGLGLLLTGLSVLGVGLAPRPHRKTPSFVGALIVGVAHGAASFPGVSCVGAALTALLWLGVRPGRALDLALLMTVPSLLVGFARAASSARGVAGSGASLGQIMLGLVVAYVAASVGAALLRSLLASRRVGALAIWVIPLGLATIAYARALPSAAMERGRAPADLEECLREGVS